MFFYDRSSSHLSPLFSLLSEAIKASQNYPLFTSTIRVFIVICTLNQQSVLKLYSLYTNRYTYFTFFPGSNLSVFRICRKVWQCENAIFIFWHMICICIHFPYSHFAKECIITLLSILLLLLLLQLSVTIAECYTRDQSLPPKKSH